MVAREKGQDAVEAANLVQEEGKGNERGPGLQTHNIYETLPITGQQLGSLVSSWCENLQHTRGRGMRKMRLGQPMVSGLRRWR